MLERPKGVNKIRENSIMPTTLKNKLSNLINEIKEIKKEVIFLEIKKTHSTKHKLNKWKLLGEKVSSKWKLRKNKLILKIFPLLF